MIRFPPSRITLGEEDLELHLQRILRHKLMTEVQHLHMDHDDNGYGPGPTYFDSLSSPSDITDSGSEPGFDSTFTAKRSEMDCEECDGDTDNTTSCAPEAVNDNSAIVPIPSIDLHSLFTRFDQHNYSSISIDLPACFSLPLEYNTPVPHRVISTHIQPDLHYLALCLRNLSLRVVPSSTQTKGSGGYFPSPIPDNC